MDFDLFLENFVAQLDDVDIKTLMPETKFRELDDWSSIVALSIIAMADEEYGVVLKGDDIHRSLTLQELFDAIACKIEK